MTLIPSSKYVEFTQSTGEKVLIARASVIAVWPGEGRTYVLVSGYKDVWHINASYADVVEDLDT